MNLLTELSSLKTLTPDAAYTADSRERIFATPRLPRRVTLVDYIGVRPHALRLVGVLGAFLLAFAGGFGVAQLTTLSDSTLGSLSQRTLEAEAQAVDVQLALTNLQAATVADAPDSTTPSSSSRIQLRRVLNASGPSSSTAIDRALTLLAE